MLGDDEFGGGTGSGDQSARGRRRHGAAIRHHEITGTSGLNRSGRPTYARDHRMKLFRDMNTTIQRSACRVAALCALTVWLGQSALAIEPPDRNVVAKGN